MNQKKLETLTADLIYAQKYLIEFEKYPDAYKNRESAMELLDKAIRGLKAEIRPAPLVQYTRVRVLKEMRSNYDNRIVFNAGEIGAVVSYTNHPYYFIQRTDNVLDQAPGKLEEDFEVLEEKPA